MAEAGKLNIRSIFYNAADYFQNNQRNLRYFWIVNFLFLTLFRFIDGGFSNHLSIIWLIAYYVYWCIFFRVYYRKKPYFWSMDFLGGIGPSIKMMFITFVVMFVLVLLPYLPLLMGFSGKYLVFFENYMTALENIEASILNQVIFALILIVISPIIVCRPFFAWISSVLGLSGSMRKAFRKTEGNYFNFILIMLLLDLPCVVIWEADKYFGYQGWLSVAFYSIFLLYINLVFAKMYDFFYHAND